MNKISKVAVGVVAVAAATLGVLTIPAGAATTATPSNTVAIPLARVVNTPGIALGNGATATVQVAGKAGVPADATAVEGILTAYQDTGVSRLVVWDGVSGAPGTPTVIGAKTTIAQPSGASSAFHVALNSGAVKVHNTGSGTRFLLAVTGYDIPAPAAGTGPAGPQGEPGKDAAILDGQHVVDSANLGDVIGGSFATRHTALTFDQGTGNLTVPGTGKELVDVSITFCRDGAQAGSPDAVPNVVVVDQNTGTALASLYGPALLGSNSQVDCGIESTVTGTVVADGGHVLEVDGKAYDANQGSAGSIKVDYGTVTVVSLGAASGS